MDTKKIRTRIETAAPRLKESKIKVNAERLEVTGLKLRNGSIEDMKMLYYPIASSFAKEIGKDLGHELRNNEIVDRLILIVGGDVHVFKLKTSRNVAPQIMRELYKLHDYADDEIVAEALQEYEKEITTWLKALE